MEIFWRLVLAHFIADFSLQTNHIAQWKRESPMGIALHVLMHPLVSAMLVWPFITLSWIKTPWFAVPGWLCILILALMHYLEDEWRVYAIQKTGSADSTGFLLWDQLIHMI